MEIRDLLMELYITYGDREFVFNYDRIAMHEIDNFVEYVRNVPGNKKIPDADGRMVCVSYITPKGMELIKGNK